MGGLPKHHGVSMGVADLNHGVIKLHMAPSSVTQEALRSTEVFAAHTLLHAPCILDVAYCIRHAASRADGDDVGGKSFSPGVTCWTSKTSSVAARPKMQAFFKDLQLVRLTSWPLTAHIVPV